MTTKTLINNPKGPERPPHHTQPADKFLVPAIVQIGEKGNEPTPKKQSQKILAPRSLLNRLAMKATKRKRKKLGENLGNRYQQRHPQMMSLNGSLLDESLSSDDEEEDTQSVQSAASSVVSLGKMKLRLRRNRQKKSKKEGETNLTVLSPLKEMELNTNRDDEKQHNKRMHDTHSVFRRSFVRRPCNASSTRITSSRTNLLDMDVPGPSPPRSSRVYVEDNAKEGMASEAAGQGIGEEREELPPVSTNTAPPAVIENASASKAGTRVLSKNTVTASSAPETPSPPQVLPPTLYHRRPETTDYASVPTCSQTASLKSSSASILPHDSNFKIFLLLLHPRNHIFELIQLFFDPTVTTIRDVIFMIPTNATEAALGAQEYAGLCRPNSSDEESISVHMKDSAQMFCGETLVAIPDGYTANEVSNLSQQILENPRICRLLASSDPLAPKAKKRVSRKEHRRRHRSSAFKALEVHDEDKPTEDKADQLSESVQVAMEKAERAAAVANAAIYELPRNSRSLVTAVGKNHKYCSDRHGKGAASGPGVLSLENALKCLDTSSASLADASERSYSLRSYENSIDHSEYSMDKSLSSWSKSLDTSFATGAVVRSAVKVETSVLGNHPPLMPTPISRRRKHMRLIRQVAGAAAVLLTSYWLDPNGFVSRHGRMERPPVHMGLTGLLQATLVFAALCKLQFLCSMPALQQSPSCLHQKSRCPFMKSRASFLEGRAQSNLRLHK